MLLIPEGYHKLQGHLRSLVRMPRLGKKAGNFAWSCAATLSAAVLSSSGTLCDTVKLPTLTEPGARTPARLAYSPTVGVAVGPSPLA